MLEQFNNLKHKDVNVRIKALTRIITECKPGGTKNQKGSQSFDYALGRLVKGLQSQVVATRQEFYAGLVALLGTVKRVPAQEIVDSIEKILGGSGGDTKSEKRLRTVANILAHGAVARSRLVSEKTFDVAVATKILNNLVAAVEKKKAFISLASPFVAHIISVHPGGVLSDEVLSGLRAFVHKSEGGSYDADQVKLILMAEQRGLTPSLGSLDNVEELLDALKAADPNDKQLLSLVLEHVRKRDFDEEFWTTFMSKIGPFDFQLFCCCICESVKIGCPLRILLTEEIVKLGLSVFHSKDLGKEARDKAVQAFGSLLTWSEGKCDLTSKEKKKALKVLYKKTPNLLFEYQVLCGVIRNHLEHLNEKELEYLGNMLMKSVSSPSGHKVSTRGQLSSLAVLKNIAQVKKSSVTVRLDIAKLFFQLGFCKPRSQEELAEKSGDGETDLENVQQQASSHFVSIVDGASDLEFVRSLHEYVKSLVDDTEETYQLRKPLTDEMRNLWKRGNKLVKKTEDEVVTLITLVGGIQLISSGNELSLVYEEWLDLVKKSKKEHGSQFVILFIVDQVVGMDRPFFNYDWVFKRFALAGKVTEEAIQSLADAIEPGDDFGDDDDDDDNTDDDEEASDEGEDEENTKMTNGTQPNGNLFSTPAKLKPGLQNGDGSDSEETIDMDEATEEDLKKMDEALAAVFAAKRRVKDQARLEVARYTRVLNLVDTLLGRYKEPPISAVLILLMPLISSVKHNLTEKSKENTLKRTLKTLERLNKFKKFSGMDEVEPDVLSTMAEEIHLIMTKKSADKVVKNVLATSMKNLLGSERISSENVNIAPQENSKAKKKMKNKKQKKKNALDLTAPITSASEPPQAEGESKKSKKKKKKEKNTGENTEKVSLPAKRKAQDTLLEKKKAKHMRLQVLSEGMSNDV